MGSREVVEAAYAAFGRGDVGSVVALFDDKIEWNEAEGFPLYDGTFVGADEVVAKVFARLGELFDDFAVNPSQFVADGDTVVVLGTYTGKAKPSGKPMEVKMAHVWTVRDDKLTTFQQHIDTLKVQEALGQ